MPAGPPGVARALPWAGREPPRYPAAPQHGAGMHQPFTLAHLSDPHLPLSPGLAPSWRQLASKRSLAFLSWRRKRGRAHSSAGLAALLADIAAARPDLVAVTGDLVNLALPGEFAAARDWLAELGPPARVVLVPGNHDALVPVPAAEGLDLWAPWLAGDAGPGFPSLRVRDGVAVLGLSSAVPTLPLLAGGRLGAAQVAAAERMLGELGRRGLFRVVLVHHSPVAGPGGWRKALWDAGPLRDALARAGAELVLHGHHHVRRFAVLPGPGGGRIPVLGVPAAALGAHGGSWHRHVVAPDPAGGWWLDTERRAWDPARGGFRAAGRWRLHLAPGPPAARHGPARPAA
ncbi:metallophosphoesterase family protein [Roseomonas sp. BN140053]|uniref:metallophosphoesterase family protein n=1 Tax=Roseomonas sp. BN140053 TaxID=3391898 RepID=UPI0039ECA78A